MKIYIKLIALLALSASFLQADLKTDLININNSMTELNSSISNVVITNETMCAPLISLNKEAQAIIDAIIVTNNGFTGPITLDDETLMLAQGLFINVAAISNQSFLLSNDIALLAPTTDAFTLGDGIRASLQLSSDIGEMADRIGEMADNILIMADNIGLMADRILETQVIQSENLVLTQNSILTTQTNILSLVSVAETASYDLSLDSLVTDGNILVAKMVLVGFTRWTMASKLEDVKIDIENYLVKVQDFQATIDSDTSNNTMYIDSGTLTSLTNLSVIMTSIGAVMEGYNGSISVLEVFTRDSVLLDSMNSMLNISADIGSMSNSILEMADKILMMSDNIGFSADQILLSQGLQSANIATTQISLLASQQLALGIISSIN
ncbi:hypothetical protein HUE87_05230 [Candidatus Sulfurimonas marisnigri]|uniref:Uncharacterized protein n=1 Tax=Candidatus Sulfurimonas marisnigri TaxID=2740405 RepID=A0A7S7M247_9BACT|nr:hypothetical protein [Candidatus Sulfurimonas marisnigri]QOY55630.1 hypothetical protein HUE87_05230 [Candidatus Sulfurimonas marisnigri]